MKITILEGKMVVTAAITLMKLFFLLALTIGLGLFCIWLEEICAMNVMLIDIGIGLFLLIMLLGATLGLTGKGRKDK